MAYVLNNRKWEGVEMSRANCHQLEGDEIVCASGGISTRSCRSLGMMQRPVVAIMSNAFRPKPNGNTPHERALTPSTSVATGTRAGDCGW
jgi:hypothetical protein